MLNPDGGIVGDSQLIEISSRSGQLVLTQVAKHRKVHLFDIDVAATASRIGLEVERQHVCPGACDLVMFGVSRPAMKFKDHGACSAHPMDAMYGMFLWSISLCFARRHGVATCAVPHVSTCRSQTFSRRERQ